MKYLATLSKVKTFDLEYVSKLIGNENSAKSILASYTEKKLIERVRQNMYSAIDLQTGDVIATRYEIGSNINQTTFICLHSAFEYYGCYNQMYNMMTVGSLSKFNTFEFQNESYVCVKFKNDKCTRSYYEVQVTTIERTIVDCINYVGYYIDLEELLKCIDMVEEVNFDAMTYYLEIVNNKFLYKKVGFIMEYFKDKFNTPDKFLDNCHKMSDRMRGYFNNRNKLGQKYVAKWKLYIDKRYDIYLHKEGIYD